MMIKEEARIAKEQGLVNFIPINPCRAGHKLRRSQDGRCVDCGKKGRKARRKLTLEQQKEEARIYAKNYREQYPDKVKEAYKKWQQKHPHYVPPSRRR